MASFKRVSRRKETDDCDTPEVMQCHLGEAGDVGGRLMESWPPSQASMLIAGIPQVGAPGENPEQAWGQRS